MKTLYININSEPVSSSEDLVVMDYDLIDDFFFYLGERIGKGCKIQNENALITDFNTPENKQDYDLILSQWYEVKRLLFSEEVAGSFDFELPSGYLHWLRYNEDYNHVYEANFSNGGSRSVTIDLEELYEDSVEALQRKIMRKLNRDDLYHEIDAIVFNDEDISRKSKIVCAIKEKYEGIGFIAYKKWSQENENGIINPVLDSQNILLIGTKKCNKRYKYDFIGDKTRDIVVFDPIKKTTILEGRYHNIDCQYDIDYLASECCLRGELFLEKEYSQKWDRFFVDGNVQRDLNFDTYWELENRNNKAKFQNKALDRFKKTHVEYRYVECIGFVKGINSYVFTCTKNRKTVDILREDGVVLFSSNNWVPVRITLDGYLFTIKESRGSFYARIVDLFGHEVNIYPSILDIDGCEIHSLKEIGPGIFCNGTGGQYYDFKLGTTIFDYHIDNMLIKENQDDENSIDIIDMHTRETLYHHIANYHACIDKLTDGLYGINTYIAEEGESRLFVFGKDVSFYLDENEEVLSNYTSGEEYTEYSQWKPFASENRIISGLYSNQHIDTIRIRDYKGTIIANIPCCGGLLIKNKYSYDKAIGINDIKRVVAIDKFGHVTDIPFAFVKGNPKEIECYFVSESHLVVNDKADSESDESWYEARLLNMDGQTLFQCDGWIIKLTDKYFKYYKPGGGYGVIDIDGNPILNAEFDDVLIFE